MEPCWRNDVTGGGFGGLKPCTISSLLSLCFVPVIEDMSTRLSVLATMLTCCYALF